MWGAIGAAGLSTAGQLYANYRNIQNQNKMFGEQINLANTAHQREVNDLRLAGLNPILSAQGGNGAETPSASLAEQENPLAAFGDMVQLENQTTTASAQKVSAEAAEKNAESTQWQVYDARTMGLAGFDVGLSLFGGANAKGKFERVYSIRLNKVTGEAYTVPGNKRIDSWTPVDIGASNSANSAPTSQSVQPNISTKVGSGKHGLAYTKDGLPIIMIEKSEDEWRHNRKYGDRKYR